MDDHSVVNGLISVANPDQLFTVIGNIAAFSYIAILAVYMFFRWYKTKELDVPVL